MAQPIRASTSRISASSGPAPVSRSTSSTTSGTWNVDISPQLRCCPYGRSAAKIAIGTRIAGPYGTAESTTVPITAPTTVPMPRCRARAKTEPKSGFSTRATVSIVQ